MDAWVPVLAINFVCEYIFIGFDILIDIYQLCSVLELLWLQRMLCTLLKLIISFSYIDFFVGSFSFCFRISHKFRISLYVYICVYIITQTKYC